MRAAASVASSTKALAAGEWPQRTHVHEGLHEEGPIWQEALGLLAHEHALQVHAVRPSGAGHGGVRQDEGHPVDPARIALEVEHVEEVLAKVVATVGEQRFAPGRAAQALVAPGGRCVEALVAGGSGERDGIGQEAPVAPDRLAHGVRGEELRPLRARPQVYLGPGRHGGVRTFRDPVELVGAVLMAAPAEHGRSGIAGRTRVHHDGVAHHEAGEQPDAELTEEITGPRRLRRALAALTDGRQEAVHLLFAQADAGVLEEQLPIAERTNGDTTLIARGPRATGPYERRRRSGAAPGRRHPGSHRDGATGAPSAPEGPFGSDAYAPVFYTKTGAPSGVRPGTMATPPRRWSVNFASGSSC